MSKFNLQAAGLLYDGYWGSGYAGLYAGLYIQKTNGQFSWFI